MQYFNNPLDTNNPWQPYPPYPPSDKPDGYDYDTAMHHAIIRVLSIVCTFIIAMIVLAVVILFTGCTAHKVVEQHDSHYYVSDSLAIQAQVDARLSAWQSRIESSWQQSIHLSGNEQSQSSQEREVITETVTTATDSLGRTLRTEQRRTERTLSLQLQQQELRLTKELEERMYTTVDSLNSEWQQRYESLQERIEQADSSSNVETPAAQDTRPWYRRWFDQARWLAIGAILAAVIILIRRRLLK